MALTEIEWSSQPGARDGGSITVDSYGVHVGTDCCGCGSKVQLTDRDDLIKLYQALGELIQARTGRRGVLFR